MHVPLVWAGLSAQMGGVGVYFLGAAVGPTITVVFIYLSGSGWEYSTELYLLHVFVPLHRNGALASFTPLEQK